MAKSTRRLGVPSVAVVVGGLRIHQLILLVRAGSQATGTQVNCGPAQGAVAATGAEGVAVGAARATYPVAISALDARTKLRVAIFHVLPRMASIYVEDIT
jgi:hypothetical protein